MVDIIVPTPLKKGEVPKYGVVNLKVNEIGFFGWINIDPHNEGYAYISDMIKIVYPSRYNLRLGNLYLDHFKKYLSSYSIEDIKKIADSLIRDREDIEKFNKI